MLGGACRLRWQPELSLLNNKVSSCDILHVSEHLDSLTRPERCYPLWMGDETHLLTTTSDEKASSDRIRPDDGHACDLQMDALVDVNRRGC